MVARSLDVWVRPILVYGKIYAGHIRYALCSEGVNVSEGPLDGCEGSPGGGRDYGLEWVSAGLGALPSMYITTCVFCERSKDAGF